MELTGLIQYMEMSRSKTVTVECNLSMEYSGYVRTITVKPDNIVKVEFEVYGYDEGGITFFIQYENIDILIRSLEKYLDKKLDEWENINQTGYYPEWPSGWKKQNADQKIREDLVSNNIKLPLYGIRTWMPEGYWKKLYDKSDIE